MIPYLYWAGGAPDRSSCVKDNLTKGWCCRGAFNDSGRITDKPHLIGLGKGCRHPCKSLSRGKRSCPPARSGERAHSAWKIPQPADVPLGSDSCFRRTRHPFAVSGPLGAVTKIECV